MLVKVGIFRKLNRGEDEKYLSCHHPENFTLPLANLFNARAWISRSPIVFFSGAEYDISSDFGKSDPYCVDPLKVQFLPNKVPGL